MTAWHPSWRRFYILICVQKYVSFDIYHASLADLEAFPFPASWRDQVSVMKNDNCPCIHVPTFHMFSDAMVIDKNKMAVANYK